MPERLSVETRNTTQWAAICSLADVSEDIMGRIIAKKEGDLIEVCLTINGEETSFTAIIAALKANAQEWAWERARQLYEERAAELGDKLRKLASLADKLEAEFKCEVGRIMPESLTDEDYR